MTKQIVQNKDGRRTLEEVANTIAEEQIKEKGELDSTEKNKIRTEVLRSMYYGGSSFGRDND